MGRSPCCEKVGLKKGPWTPEEDQKLMAFIEQHGHGSWRALPAKAGLRRCGKSCRLRWTNYLRPDIKRGKFSLQEERTIIQLHALLGNRWSVIASHLPKRTDNEIKNYWNSNLKKRLTRMGIDPITHKPKTNSQGQSNNKNKDTSNLSHMAQWESARLEAEARLVRESKLQGVQNNQAKPSSCSSPSRLVMLNKTHAQLPSLPPCLDVLKAWQSSWSNSNYSDSSESLPQSKDNNKMHSMLAMMLATDDLDSPTSTLSFPESMMHTVSKTTTTTPVIGVINENLLPPTTLPVATAMDIDSLDHHQCSKSTSTPSEGGNGTMKDASGIESWRCLTNQNPEAEGETDDEKRMENTMEGLHLQYDDDVMVAVEAFRGVGFENNNNATPLIPSSYVMEGINNDTLVFDSNENLAEENLALVNNGDGSSSNVNFEENKDSYWGYCMLDFVDDSHPGSPIF